MVTIKTESQTQLDEILVLLQTNPALKLSIEGHTDNTGTAEGNRKLSGERAKAVMAALAAKGFGQDKPVADNASEDGRAKNRRVELVKL